jgi:hypothetical protein
MNRIKYFVWRHYLRQQTGWIGTHIAAGPKIIITMIIAGIIQALTGFYYTPWYEIVIWTLIGIQIWLSFELCGIGFYKLFPISPKEIFEFNTKLKNNH